ncbi:hypothetical protein [Halalkalibacter okhensis]|uniref:Uncharacterized protein n=1 Tax=Halalkalibacter okhensis TaxID=333138 RepID=A0A0B0ICB9_9BACI|nr:hypothetical protein [Halalkalibacter okhensis]KHF38532.1 hypothetical protein LQ50_20470 [Halalkalibacter okhensis]
MIYKRIFLLSIVFSIVFSLYGFSMSEKPYDGDTEISDSIEWSISEGGLSAPSFQAVITKLWNSTFKDDSSILSNYIVQLFDSPIPVEKRMVQLMTVKYQSTFFSSLMIR